MSKKTSGMEDLLCDDTFLSWDFKTDVLAVRRWDQWIADNPESQLHLEEAIDFLSFLTLQEEKFTREQISRSEKVLLDRIRVARGKDQREQRPAGIVLPYTKRTWKISKVWAAAASVIMLATGAALIYNTQRKAEWNTAYGEVKTNSLPDGSEVVVNAHSSLRYTSAFTDGKDREVWLSGEAFFHVRKTPLKSRFIVHTKDFDIIVTGTRFNAVNRDGKANILLEEGSVLLQTEGGELVPMKPGEFAEYDHDHLAKRMVKMDSVTAWKEHKLAFDNTSIKVVAAIIEEQYGVHVRLEGETIGTKTVSGIMPNDNLDVLLKALEATAEFKILRRDDDVSIIQN
jgi:ferric-dicitrate binding protein FerR (iron transport regulator)